MKLKKIESKIKVKLKQMYYLRCYYKKEIVDDVVLIESKQGEDLAGNMFYILREISTNYPEYKIYLAVKTSKIDNIRAMLKKHKLNSIEIVRHKSLEYYKLLATAKYLFNDTIISNKYSQKEKDKYIQIHGMEHHLKTNGKGCCK